MRFAPVPFEVCDVALDGSNGLDVLVPDLERELILETVASIDILDSRTWSRDVEREPASSSAPQQAAHGTETGSTRLHGPGQLLVDRPRRSPRWRRARKATSS